MPTSNQAGTNVFITGVSSGLGKQLARLYLQKGHTVWGVGRRAFGCPDLDFTVPEGRFRYSVCDVSSSVDVQKVGVEMSESGFLPDLVILNAGVSIDDINGGFHSSAFEATFKTNVFGAVKWVEVFLPFFLERGAGTFAAISSLAAYRGISNRKIGYPSSKAAVNMAFEGLRLHYAGSGIRFICFCPGPMAEGPGSVLSTGFDRAAGIIFHFLSANTRRNEIGFPFRLVIFYRICRYLPDRMVSLITRFMTGKVAGNSYS